MACIGCERRRNAISDSVRKRMAQAKALLRGSDKDGDQVVVDQDADTSGAGSKVEASRHGGQARK